MSTTSDTPIVAVAIAAAVALVALLAAPWYSVRYGAATEVDLATAEASAYTALNGADVAIPVLAGIAAVCAHLTIGGGSVMGLGFVVASAAALVLVLIKMLDPPTTPDAFGDSFTFDVSLAWGIWASLAAALVLTGIAILRVRA